MKKFLIIIFLLGLSSTAVYSQLLEDTDRKLKNSKVERNGFLFFRNKKKIKNSDGIPTSKRESSPRYSSSSSSFRLNKKTSPRYSSLNERTRKYSVRVLSSRGVFKFKSVTSSPRYSSKSPFGKNIYKTSPRYTSRGIPFRGVDYKIVTRNSAGNPFRGSDYKVSPRYSPGNPFRGNKYKITSRYSPGNPFSGSKYRISPRYSNTAAKSWNFRFAYPYSPVRYSEEMPFRGNDYNIKPRYSKEMPFRRKDYNISSRYTGSKLGFFKMVGNRELAIAHYYQESSL